MSIKRRFWFLMVIVLLLLLVPACGGGDDEDNTPTPTATSAPTSTATAAPTVNKEPVKLGIINPWSGPMATSGGLVDQVIKVVEQQLEEMGGILGGRQVEFFRGDDRGTVAESAAQAKKLVLQEKVDMLLFGGVTGASFGAVATEAEAFKIPFVSMSQIYGGTAMKYSISVYSTIGNRTRMAKFPIDYVKPKTVALLALDDVGMHNAFDGDEDNVAVKKHWKDAGIDTIYETYYSFGATDFSPYLTAIKYKKPDLVVIASSGIMETLSINKQITELGGWGDIKVFHCYSAGSNQKAVAMPGALGNYVSVDWQPGSDDPGMKAFEDAFKKTHGRLPSPELAYSYNCIWTGIKAIELAGTTDPDKVAQAMRSGNLEWDSAWGHLRILPDGRGVASVRVAEVQGGGKLVKVWTWNPE